MNNQNVKFSSNIDTSEYIKLKYIFNFFLRNKFLIGSISAFSLIISLIVANFSKKVWEGQFEIVLSTESNSPITKNLSSNLGFLDSLDMGSQNSLETQLGILKSPSVLMPIFEYIKNEKQKINGDQNNISFSSWRKDFINVQLKKKTSILSFSYRDYDKDLIIPTLSRISKTYQDYAGKNRIRNLVINKKFLEEQIKIYKSKSSESFKIAQDFAIKQDLIINETAIKNDSNLTNNKDNSENLNNQAELSLMGSIVDLERIRVNAANKIRNIDLQIEKINNLNDDAKELQYIGSTIPGLVRTGLPEKLEKLENQIIELKSKYTDEDNIIKRVLNERKLLINLMRDRSIGYLEAERLSTEAQMESAMRPKGGLIKYRELIREAARDEMTLISLEDQLNLLQINQSKSQDPWELITNPTLIPSPVAPIKENYILIGLLIGFFISSLTSYLLEKKSLIIYEIDYLKELFGFQFSEIINFKNNKPKNFNRNILQNEVFQIDNKIKTQIIISQDINKDKCQKVLKSIFDKEDQYEIIEEFNKLEDKNKIFLLVDLYPISLDEMNLIKDRLELADKKLFGVFFIK